MKIKVQAQHLQKGDIVGSGEEVTHIMINSTQWKSNKVLVGFKNRSVLWGKYTQITVDRME